MVYFGFLLKKESIMDKQIIPITEYQGSHPNKTVVGTIEGRIYYTTRTTEHFFRIFEGFGLSIAVYNQLVEHGVKKVLITYCSHGVKKYLLTNLNDWFSYGGYYTNLISVNKELVVDPQFALPISEMKEIREEELNALDHEFAN
jgi:hypothetical protein